VHARIPNGGLKHAQGRVSAAVAFGRNPVPVAENGKSGSSEEPAEKELRFGIRIGYSRDIRCPDCRTINHNISHEEVHKCDSTACKTHFKVPTLRH
jgi:hypothetical protein